MEFYMKMRRITDRQEIRRAVEEEIAKTGGIFRLAPAWVARPGIVQPGRRLKLNDEYMAHDLAVNERWLASATYADNGAYNGICPEDHGYSYIVTAGGRIMLKDAFAECPGLMLDNKPWDVLPKFFDNWHRIPFHMHPCKNHVREGLVGKPESYHFPVELNMDRNAFPSTPIGVDPYYSDAQILDYLMAYFKGDNRLTDLGNTVNIIAGTGYYMPPCTLHAPGSLVTYELQTASDVSCIAESRVNDMPMPPDMVDRDLPVTIKDDGMAAVCEYMLRMIRCENAGNSDSFRKEYFRPPVRISGDEDASREYVVYRCGKASEKCNEDLYSAKKTSVYCKKTIRLAESAAFGAVVLRGSGRIFVEGRAPLHIESASMFLTRDECLEDEFFVAACAAGKARVACDSKEPLTLYEHFASNSNKDAASLPVPEYMKFNCGG